jgi:hypothetical protein
MQQWYTKTALWIESRASVYTLGPLNRQTHLNFTTTCSLFFSLSQKGFVSWRIGMSLLMKIKCSVVNRQRTTHENEQHMITDNIRQRTTHNNGQQPNAITHLSLLRWPNKIWVNVWEIHVPVCAQPLGYRHSSYSTRRDQILFYFRYIKSTCSTVTWEWQGWKSLLGFKIFTNN